MLTIKVSYYFPKKLIHKKQVILFAGKEKPLSGLNTEHDQKVKGCFFSFGTMVLLLE